MKVFGILCFFVIIQFSWAQPSDIPNDVVEEDIEKDENDVFDTLTGCGVTWDDDSRVCANKYVSGLNNKRIFDVGWDAVLDELVKCGFKTDNLESTLKCLEPKKSFRKIEQDMNVEDDIEDDENDFFAALPGCKVSSDTASLDCAHKYVSGLNKKRMFDVGWDVLLDNLIKCGFKADDLVESIECLRRKKVFKKIEEDMNV